MNREQYLPPAPEVQHLPTLLRRVQAGELRVPAFQRGYVWLEKQIIELLESIYNGYPIGSLLFWQPTDSGGIRIKADTEFPIPGSPGKYPATFILDGQQRLATIYNCFYNKTPSEPDRFNVTFDLRQQTFQHYRTGDSRSGRIPLGSLFAPKAFLEAQQGLAQQADADVLLDSSVALHSAFQEYMVPIVNIRGRETADVVRIFERINNTGARLSAVDFMRAMTWSESYDLSHEIKELTQQAEESGFAIPPEALVKMVAISQGLDPTPESMLRLRGASIDELRHATKQVSRALNGALQFLKDQLHIHSYEYVPYEAQMLVVVKLFMASDLHPHKRALRKLAQWLLRTSIMEELQGKADSVIAFLVRSVDKLVEGDTRAFDGRLELNANDLISRKFIVRRALSSALAIVFAARQARSLVSGHPISQDVYMSEFTSAHFVPILTGDALMDGSGGTDKRIFPNVCLVTEDDRRVLRAGAAAWIADSSDSLRAALDSQAISDEAVDALRAGRPDKFLELRSRDIHVAVDELVS